MGSDEGALFKMVTESIVSVDGEHLALLSPLDTSASRGCVEKLLMQIEIMMRRSVHHSIITCTERISKDFSASSVAVTTTAASPAETIEIPQSAGAMAVGQNHRRSKWMLQHMSAATSANNSACLQALIMGAFVVATGEISEAIKGGQESMKSLAVLYQKFQDDCASALMAENQNGAKLASNTVDLNHLKRKGLSALILQDMKTSGGIKDLLQRQVVGEKDFGWRIKPRAYMTSMSEVTIDILQHSYAYQYEYLGGGEGCFTSVWHRGLEKSAFAILHAFRVKRFPALFGPQEGKLTAVKEVACKLLGRPLMVRAAANHMDRSTFESYLSGVRHSGGIWLCIVGFDRLPMTTLSHLAPELQSLQEAFRANIRRGEDGLCGADGGYRGGGGGGGGRSAETSASTVADSGGGFLCFTTTPGMQDKGEIPANVTVTMRPISVVLPSHSTPSIGLIASLLYSKNGLKESNTAMAHFLHDSISFFAHMWRSKHFFGLQFLRRVLAASDVNQTGSSPENCLRLSLLMHLEAMLGSDTDISLAKKVTDGLWNQNTVGSEDKSNIPDDECTILPCEIKQVYDEMGLHSKEQLICKTRHFIRQLTTHNAIIIAGPTMTGKSKIVAVSERIMDAQNTVIYPKSIPLHYLFGRKTQDHAKWHDGILTNIIRKSQTMGSTRQQWITLRGSIDTLWTTALENLMLQGPHESGGQSQFLDLLSGEHLLLQRPLKLVIETNYLDKCSPATIAKCALVSLNTDHLNWRVLFDCWFKNNTVLATGAPTKYNQNRGAGTISEAAAVAAAETVTFGKENRWKKGQEPLIKALFEKMVPPIIEFFQTRCRPRIGVNSTACFRNLLEIFVTSLNEAILNLKEKKYLRSWIQAAFVFSVTWSFGGILEQEEKIKFDSWFRDILMGKSPNHPLPAVLNNKFDSMPPTEGTVFDFIFDYKARGQWKHWNDSLKTTPDTGPTPPPPPPPPPPPASGEGARTAVPSASSATAGAATDIFITTSDTARFNHLVTISESNNRPFLLLGPPCCGKTAMVHQRLKKDSPVSSYYEFVSLSTSSTKELNDWMLSTLTKRKRQIYGPEMSRGVIFVDDFSAPKPDETGVVHIQQMIQQLIDTSSWYSLSSNMKMSLERVGFVVAATPEYNAYGGVGSGSLDDIFSARFHMLCCDQPSGETLNKFFTTALTVRFKERNFPPEVTSVIPTLVQSTVKVYQECKKVLSGGMTDIYEHGHASSLFIRFPPNLRDVFRTIEGCSTLPRESAENKKLFTRLWVHEALRNFYDRLTTTTQRAAIFDSIKSCVKSIFRENFDSAFEHLGKVDGQVTEQNLRNLLFGSYLASSVIGDKEKTGEGNDTEVDPATRGEQDSGSAHTSVGGMGRGGGTGCVAEIQNFDSLERSVRKAMEDDQKVRGTDRRILPIRHTLELISHINHALTTPSTSVGDHGGSHLIIGGQGGEGRAMASRIAAKLSNFVFFPIPNSPTYTKEAWRSDLRDLIKRAGSHATDTVIYVSAGQLLRYDFILYDVNSLMARGKVFNLFTLEERHELNESVHTHLLGDGLSLSGANYDLSPTALYEIFVSICKKKLHLIIAYNSCDHAESELMFRMNFVLTKTATHIVIEEWAGDDLRKAAELLIEELNLDRDTKKNFITMSMQLYKEARLHARMIQNPNIIISSVAYIRYVNNFMKLYKSTTTKLNDTKRSYDSAIDRYKRIGEELEQLKNDLDELKPKLEKTEEVLRWKCKERNNLCTELENIIFKRKVQEKNVDALLQEERQLKREHDNIINPLLEELNERRCRVQDLRQSDLGMAKTLKNGTPPIRICVSAICILLDVPHDKMDVASEKKNTRVRIKFHEGADYWTNGKRLLMDPAFQDRLLKLDLDRELLDTPEGQEKNNMSPKLRVLVMDILPHPDWDPFQAGKVFMPAEVLCHWLTAVTTYYQKRMDMMHVLNKMENGHQAKNTEIDKLEMMSSETKANEKQLDDLKTQIAALEEERRSKLVDQTDILTKCEVGDKLKELLHADFDSMMKELKQIKKMIAGYLGDAISLAFTTSIACSFPRLDRLQLDRTLNIILSEITQCCGWTREFRQLWLKEQCSEGMDMLEDDQVSAEVFAAIKICERSCWPLLWDPDSTGLHWLIKNCQRQRGKQKIVCLQQNDLDSDKMTKIVVNAVKNGDILILYEIKLYDSDMDALYSRRIRTDGDGRDMISIAGVEIPYDKQFQLFIVASDRLDTELLTKCMLIDFSNNAKTLEQLFLRNVFRRENPRGYRELMCMRAKRQIILRLAEKSKLDILELLTTSDSSILDKNECTAMLFAKKAEIEDFEARGNFCTAIIQYWETESESYKPAAKHANMLYEVTSRLRNINYMYDFSLQWFLRILNTALENSNKSKVLEKRLRYIQDTITYSVYNQVTNSLKNCDRLLFSFVLAMELLMTEGHLEYDPASVMVDLWRMHEGKNNDISGCPNSEVHKNSCEEFIWLPRETLSFFSQTEGKVLELKGICEDLSKSSAKWRVVVEAKEPDNLPLHEPWYSQLSKFARFVVIAALRPDKILELVHSFISDIVGFKFVDPPADFDLGRVLTDAENSQVIIFQSEMGDAARQIKDFAFDKNIDISTFSMGEERSSNVIRLCEDLRKSGHKWLLLENFHEEGDKPSILRMHTKIHQSFHSNYRLFIVTKECSDFPSLPLKNSVKFVLEPPLLFRDLLLENFDSTGVRRITRLWEQKDTKSQLHHPSPHVNEGRFARLLYGLCMFHSMANFRTRYGSRGGWNCVKGFDFNDLDSATEYLEVKFLEGIYFENFYGLRYYLAPIPSHSPVLQFLFLPSCTDHDNRRRKLFD